jgi:MFS family permease
MSYNFPMPGPGRSAARRRAAVPAGVWALGFVSLLMDVSSEMIHSLLPIFLVTVLGAGATTVGLIEGVADATTSLTKAFSGRLSDYLGKRRALLLAGYGLAAASKPLFALAPDAAFVLAARFVDRVGKGIRGAPRDALIADITAREDHGAAYGLRQALDTVGAVAGPLIALALMAASGENFRLVFWCALAPALLSVLVIVVAVREPPRNEERPKQIRLRTDELRAFGPAYWLLIAVAVLLGLSRASEGFILLRAESAGLSATLVPLTLVAISVVFMLAAYPAGLLSDRFGRIGLLALGIGTLILSQLALAAASAIGLVFLGAALWGLQLGLTQGLLAALVADQAPVRLRGTAFGLFHLASGAATIPGNLVAGVVWDAAGAPAAFLVGAAGSALALGTLGLWRRVVSS